MPFLSNGNLTTNSCYIHEFIPTDTGTDILDSTFYDNYPTNSSFYNCINTLSTAYTSPEVEGVNGEKQENLDILDSFMSLQDDWDGCNAISPVAQLINLVKALVWQLQRQPEIFPTPDGGIQLEYAIGTNRHLNIEILSEQNVNVFEMFADRTFKEETIRYNVEDIKRRIDIFYGRI